MLTQQHFKPITVWIDTEDFWSKVQKSGQCWNWKGKTWFRRRYGNYRLFQAHRVAFQLTIGDIPPGMVILHVCDNPACVRPDHLRLGTQAENVADTITKGRAKMPPSGEQHWNWKRRLKQIDRKELKRRFHAGNSISKLAREFHLSLAGCWSIVTDNGKHRIPPRYLSGENHPLARLKWEDVHQIRRLAQEGLQIRQISKQYGMCYASIYNIVRGRSWRLIVA